MRTACKNPIVPTPARPSNDFAARSEVTRRLGSDAEVYQRARRRFPIRWPRYYLNLVGTSPQSDPIARMGGPHPDELRPDRSDISDPVADLLLRPVPFVVRKHRDRVIILAAKRCHFYCRFCFRREEPVNMAAQPGENDWREILQFLASQPEIEEPILSGGDPLTLTDETLFWIREQLERIPSLLRRRIHTRAPVHYPQRVTRQLTRGLVGTLPLTIVTHYNHAHELTGESRRIAGLLGAMGIAYQNQAVLLAGVNDGVEVQLSLWRGLHELGIAPRYLHHPDRAPGNARFRVTIARGLRIYRGFRDRLQSPAPRYVLDLPDGRGKIPVESLEPMADGVYRYLHGNGLVSHYRDIDAGEESQPASEHAP